MLFSFLSQSITAYKNNKWQKELKFTFKLYNSRWENITSQQGILVDVLHLLTKPLEQLQNEPQEEWG